MDKAKHYRARADEMRTIAEGIFDHKERKTLLEIAQEYEELALGQNMFQGYADLARGRPKRPNGAEQKPDRDSS